MEGIHMLKYLLRAGDWMAKIDLKDAYFMIPIAQKDRDFLKFQWKDQTYQFNCLPFRLSSAPWVFTKTIWPVVAALRKSDRLHRQYSRHGGDQVSPQIPCDSSSVHAGEPGVCDKPLQIRTGPFTGNRIPGVHC